LKDGVTPIQAQGELAVMSHRESQQERDYAGIIPQVKPLSTELNRDGNRILWPLLGAAAVVLLIACGNTGSLMLVRGIQRQQEYSVRSALGIARSALIWQASLENLVIALGGGALGVGLAFGLMSVLKAIGGHAIPRLDSASAGWPILLCGLAAALVSAVLAGLVPAFRASRIDAAEVLKAPVPKAASAEPKGNSCAASPSLKPL
jgi:putative ABC transport system permease protein